MKEKVKLNFKQIWDDVWVNGTIVIISSYFMALLGIKLHAERILIFSLFLCCDIILKKGEKI